MYKNFLIVIMFSFLSFGRKDYREVPEWANFFSQQEYTYFINTVETFFKQKGFEFTIEDGYVSVSDNDFGLNKLGLVNLAQTCYQENRSRWKGIISNHFNRMIEISDFETEFNSKVDEFENIKSYIGVRIYPIEYVQNVESENTIYRNITDELVELLIFDLPHAVINVKQEVSKKWKIDHEELFSIGEENIQINYSIDVTEHNMTDFNIWFIQGDHVFASNVLLHNDELTKYLGEKGALIGVPHRHAVIIYPINELEEVIKAINTLPFVISGMYNEGPGSISEKMYWYTDQNFIDLPYKLTEDKLEFFPPEAFVNMLNEFKN
jgi:hypothetical protein